MDSGSYVLFFLKLLSSYVTGIKCIVILNVNLSNGTELSVYYKIILLKFENSINEIKTTIMSLRTLSKNALCFYNVINISKRELFIKIQYVIL